jgi:REP element-mobilizing transposase RayT
MPDHLHMLVEGVRDDAHFPAFMKLVRQRCAVEFNRLRKQRLWQDGYFEHVLRNEEATESVIYYIVGNPVRAGLVERIHDYPYSFPTTL